MVRYSMACRPIESKGDLIRAGHGGRWTDKPDDCCPHCGRPMALLGAVVALPVGATDG